MNELMPRNLFAKDKTLFRMDDHGDRVAGGNLCVTSPRALEIVAENAQRLAKRLRPTTGRYFMWGDDGAPWCRCKKCRELSDSDQALLVANHILKAIRPQDPNATIAHLAYLFTIDPPRKVKPAPGVFLEYAPINRRYDIPLAQQTAANDKEGLAKLDANLQVFPANTAQVLEYWLRCIEGIELEETLETANVEQGRLPQRRANVCCPRHPAYYFFRCLARRGLRQTLRPSGVSQRVRSRFVGLLTLRKRCRGRGAGCQPAWAD